MPFTKEQKLANKISDILINFRAEMVDVPNTDVQGVAEALALDIVKLKK